MKSAQRFDFWSHPTAPAVQTAYGRWVRESEYDALAAQLSEVTGERDLILIRAENAEAALAQAEARLDEFHRLYRGQIANDGSYPDHLFTSDSADEAPDFTSFGAGARAGMRVSASALPSKILPVNGLNEQNNSTSDSADACRCCDSTEPHRCRGRVDEAECSCPCHGGVK